LSNKGLDGFRRMAGEILERETRYRPGLQRATAAVRAECLAVLEGAARQAAAPYRGRRTALVKGKRVPVAKIAAAGALSVFRKYLTERNIPRREVVSGDPCALDDVGTEGTAEVTLDAGVYGRAITARSHVEVDDGDSVAPGVTAAPIHGGETRGGYESGAITEFRSKRSRGAPPGMSEGSRSMSRDASATWLHVPWSGNFVRRAVVLAHNGGCIVTAPAGPWQRQREVIRHWVKETGGFNKPLSLLDIVLPGVRVESDGRVTEWRWGRVFEIAQRSLLDEVAA
jgi:hypothetical protein